METSGLFLCQYEFMTKPLQTGPTLALTVDEAARELRVSKSQIWEWIRTGQLRSVSLAPKVRRIRRADLEAFMDRMEEAASAEAGPFSLPA